VITIKAYHSAFAAEAVAVLGKPFFGLESFGPFVFEFFFVIEQVDDGFCLLPHVVPVVLVLLEVLKVFQGFNGVKVFFTLQQYLKRSKKIKISSIE